MTEAERIKREAEIFNDLRQKYLDAPDHTLRRHATAIAKGEQRRAQKVLEIVRGELGWRQRLELWDLARWWRANGMQAMARVIAALMQNTGHLSTTALGVALLLGASFVTFYCATDATGGWIDPNCAYYVKIGLWAGGLGNLLAPGFTATISKPPVTKLKVPGSK